MGLYSVFLASRTGGRIAVRRRCRGVARRRRTAARLGRSPHRRPRAAALAAGIGAPRRHPSGRRASGGRLRAGRAAPLESAAMRLSPTLLHHPPRRPGRRRDGVASAARARRLPAPARLRDLLAPAARLPRAAADRADHPRGARRHRRAGDGDAGRAPGRPVARDRPLRRRSAPRWRASRTGPGATWCSP